MWSRCLVRRLNSGPVQSPAHTLGSPDPLKQAEKYKNIVMRIILLVFYT